MTPVSLANTINYKLKWLHPGAWPASCNGHNSNGHPSTSLESWSNARNNTVQINRFPPLQLPEFLPLCASSLGIENWEMSGQRVSLLSRTDVSFSPFFLRQVHMLFLPIQSRLWLTPGTLTTKDYTTNCWGGEGRSGRTGGDLLETLACFIYRTDQFIFASATD